MGGIILKRILLVFLGLLLTVTLLSWDFHGAQANASSHAKGVKRYEKIELPKVKTSESNLLKNKNRIKEKPVRKELSAQQIEKLKELGPYAMVSSHGKIIDQSKYVKKGKLLMQRAKEHYLSKSRIQAEDNRIRIDATTSPPYNAIASLEFLDKDENVYSCTGYYIDRNTVVTAAHCVFDTWNDEWLPELVWVAPGRKGNELPYDWTYGIELNIVSGWVNVVPPKEGYLSYDQVQYDFAVIQVADSHSKWMDLYPFGYGEGDTVNATGFPGDKEYGYMYNSTGKITNWDTSYNVITHSCYVWHGTSGGPIWSQSGNRAIGIVSTTSWSPLIHSSVYNLIYEWANENG